MKGSNRLSPTGGNLASEISEASVNRLYLVKVRQERKIEICCGPEEVVSVFIEALNKYPPSVLKIPISIVLIEISSNGCMSKRRMNKALKRIGALINSALGENTVLTRYGKSMFTGLLIGVDEQAAGKICQRVKEAIHRHCYLVEPFGKQPEVQFAIAQHDLTARNDFAELVFGNEQIIRLARALGDGAVVTRRDAKGFFYNHRHFNFTLGDVATNQVYFELNS